MTRWVLLIALVILPCAPAHAGHGEAQLLFTFRDPAISESSGVTASADPDVWFTHNDSGDAARFFAVDASGETIARYQVAGAAAVDWEDMAKGPGRDGSPALYLGDIGDNVPSSRRSITVYEVPEPDTSSPFQTVATSAVHHLLYEDGPHDAETLMVDPDGRIVVVTKDGAAGIAYPAANTVGLLGVSGVYVAEPPVLPGRPALLKRMATIRFNLFGNPDTSGPYPANRVQTTGGDISPDGERVTIRTYPEAFEWPIPDGDLAAAFAGSAERIGLPKVQQGEAIAYASDGESLVITSEGVGAPVHLVPVDGRPPTTIAVDPPSVDGITATVTSAGSQLAGIEVVFRAGVVELCRTATDASGRASCDDPDPVSLALARGVSVSFDGDSDHAPSVGVAPL